MSTGPMPSRANSRPAATSSGSSALSTSDVASPAGMMSYCADLGVTMGTEAGKRNQGEAGDGRLRGTDAERCRCRDDPAILDRAMTRRPLFELHVSGPAFSAFQQVCKVWGLSELQQLQLIGRTAEASAGPL